MNGKAGLGLVLLLIGILVNNYAYPQGLVYKHVATIWIGPLSCLVAALGIVAILVRARQLANRQP